VAALARLMVRLMPVRRGRSRAVCRPRLRLPERSSAKRHRNALYLAQNAPSLSQICRGLLPMEYRMLKKPDWNVFLRGRRAAAAESVA
jgi:hypothetical protein